MGRGSQSGGVFNGKLLFASIKGAKKGENIHFELSSRVNKESPIVNEGHEQSLSGGLVKAEHRIWQHEGISHDSVVLYLSDPTAGKEGETYKIETSMGGTTRNIIQSLLSAKNFLDPITIDLYTNKKGYASVAVKQGVDEAGKPAMLPWVLSLEDQKKYISVDKKKGKGPDGRVIDIETNNYVELELFLLNEFKTKIIPMVNGRAASAPVIAQADQSWPNAESGELPLQGDDLPF